MTDFFARMFALTSDDEEESYSTDDEFGEGTRGRKQYSHNKPQRRRRSVGRSGSLSSSSTSSETKEGYSPHQRLHHDSGSKKHKERQRRNDQSARSEARRRHSKKSQLSSSTSRQLKLHLHSPSRGDDHRSPKD